MFKRTTADLYSNESSTVISDADSEPGTKRRRQDAIPSKAIFLKSGRLRLTDKLMSYLNANVVPDVLYWQDGGTAFSFDTAKVQKEVLDRYFKGMKLSSFTRSLNRWGFKRTFYGHESQTCISYEHPLFKRDSPDLVAEMTMVHHPIDSTASIKSTSTNTTTKCTAVEEIMSNDVRSTRENASEYPHASPVVVPITTSSRSVPSVSSPITTSSRSDPSVSSPNGSYETELRCEEAENMVSQLRTMGDQLQSIFDKQQEKIRQQQEQLTASRMRRQIALQAIAATRQSDDFRVSLGLNQLGLERIVQSSLMASTAKRSTFSIDHAAFASPPTTITTPASSGNSAQLTTKLLLRILADSNSMASSTTKYKPTTIAPRRFF